MSPQAFIIAIDISDAALRRAKELYGNDNMLQFIVGNAVNIPLRTNSVDVIVSIELYEHLEAPLRMLSEAYRVLKERGALLIATPNARSLSAIVRGEKYIELKDDTHISLTIPEQLKKNLVKVRFSNVNCFTNGFPLLNIIGRMLNKLIKAPLGLGSEILCIAIKDSNKRQIKRNFHNDEIQKKKYVAR
jgi:SAM-dependent methyltransferase